MKLHVMAEGQYGSYRASMVIPELYRREFEPLKICDDHSLAYATGELLVDDLSAKIVMRARKDSAKILAAELAEIIVCAMQQHDTHNGYPKHTNKEQP